MHKRQVIITYVKSWWWWNRKRIGLEVSGTSTPWANFTVQLVGKPGPSLPLSNEGKWVQIHLNGKWVTLDLTHDQLLHAVDQCSAAEVQSRIVSPERYDWNRRPKEEDKEKTELYGSGPRVVGTWMQQR